MFWPSRSLKLSWPQTDSVSAAMAGVMTQLARPCAIWALQTSGWVGARHSISALAAERDQRAGGGQALAVDLVDQHAARNLADQRRQGADAEGEAECAQGPAVLRQPDGNERAKPGLNRRGEEVQAIQAELAAHTEPP